MQFLTNPVDSPPVAQIPKQMYGNKGVDRNIPLVTTNVSWMLLLEATHLPHWVSKIGAIASVKVQANSSSENRAQS